MTAIESGLEAIRAAVALRARKSHLAGLAHDVSAGTAALDSFSRGEGTLPHAILDALARELFDATYDAAKDRLRGKPRAEPKPLGTPPAPYQPPQVSYTVGETARGPQPVNAAPPSSPKKRPGWAD